MSGERGGERQWKQYEAKLQQVIDYDNESFLFPFLELLRRPEVKKRLAGSCLLHHMIETRHTKLMSAFVLVGVWPELIEHRSGNQNLKANELAESMGHEEEQLMIQECSERENSIQDQLKDVREGSTDEFRKKLKQGNKDFLSEVDDHGCGLLWWACIGGHLETVKFVIGDGTDDPNANAKWSMLQWMAPLPWSPKDVVDCIIEKFNLLCADVGIVNQLPSDRDRRSLIQQSHDFGNLYAAKKLLELGAVCSEEIRKNIEAAFPNNIDH